VKTLFMLFFLGSILFAMSSCQKTSHQITEEDIAKIINEKIPAGTSKSDVVPFLNTLKIASRSVKGINFWSGRSQASYVEDSQPPNVYSHITAMIPETGIYRDGIFTQTYYISMTFYFDENEKLIGYNLHTFLNA
jgi:hypothetical protein